MIPPTYDVFNKFTQWCRSKVPTSLAKPLSELKLDDEAVKRLVVKVCRWRLLYSVIPAHSWRLLAAQHGIEVCRNLLSGGCKSLHFYTMNLEVSVCAILEVCVRVLGSVYRVTPN
jgi:5,10-methylenetetrahydrofolate reductase